MRRQLRLSKTTLRNLSAQQLKGVVGNAFIEAEVEAYAESRGCHTTLPTEDVCWWRAAAWKTTWGNR